MITLANFDVQTLLQTIAALFAFASIFLFPGLPLTRLLPNIPHKIILAISLSASFWMTVFTLLQFVKIPFDLAIVIGISISIGIWIIHKPNICLPVRKTACDLWLLGLCLVLIVLFGRLFFLLIAPSGGDMATHSYIARLILEKNSYPDSYEPLVPIRSFGSYSTGMPVLIAVTSRVISLPIYRSALVMTIAAYVWFGISLYMFIHHWFPRPVSFITAVLITIASPAVLYYLPWGGNPTVLATAFLIQAIILTIKLLLMRPVRKYLGILPALLFFASFTTHHIPFITSLYALIPILIGYILFHPKKTSIIQFTSIIATTLIFLSLPFLLQLKYPSMAALELIRDWQQGDHGHVWRGTIFNAYTTIPRYIIDRLGSLVPTLALGSIFLMLFFRRRPPLWIIWTFTAGVITIMNSRYWVLPFSPVLYPERIASLLSIPLAWCIAWAFTHTLQLVQQQKNKLISSLGVIIGCVLFITVSYRPLTHYYSQTIARNLSETSVTAHDLQVINWIAAHTPPQAVIANNYGDAGIWIPAIAYRKVTYNDVNPYDFDELFAAQHKLTPSYIYIGAKAVYTRGDHIRYTRISPEIIDNIPVFRAGAAALYPYPLP